MQAGSRMKNGGDDWERKLNEWYRVGNVGKATNHVCKKSY
jgi:hypothetical protein